jgi:hypothetical protein
MTVEQLCALLEDLLEVLTRIADTLERDRSEQS